MRRLYAGILLCSALACASKPKAPILLFNGAGTSRGDVAAIEQILRDHRLRYDTAGSSDLNAMDASQLHAYRLLIFPGGNFEQMGKGLTPATSANINRAINRGTNYLGICAGAFLAGSCPYNGLNLTKGTQFHFYAAEAQGIRKTAVWVQAKGEQPLQHYWEDGPVLTGWGDVVAKYPDGTAAIVQSSVGEGWVILTGVHPEAPESWRRGMSFSTSADLDNAYAAKLVEAALHRTPLPHF